MDLREVCLRAAGGDQRAWVLLVRHSTGLVLAVARAYRLGEADAWDVCQSTWLALATSLPCLRDPAALQAWLVTTARRQAVRVVVRRRHELCPRPERVDDATQVRSPEALLISDECRRAFWRALAGLPKRHRQLLWLLVMRPDLSHAQLAIELRIAPGSVGPLRARCFGRMRARLLADGFDGGDLR
ncbi:RNA polymerase sigma factor, sigma-70 family [Amycolatopsis marina]|uniref:RNA polymerase sigma factor, sigma-70 family n=1 Tax=Amycolatopsis marina TaxID=490629 RepID=A0A1I0XIV9_9PSEU|nr:sigma-70 family RNA polymerase sigma factor [Amycolatopsis marina]SFB00250.1 RNA polymerase sigma factor, sigma-70 family [Amycolatopsis marina]